MRQTGFRPNILTSLSSMITGRKRNGPFNIEPKEPLSWPTETWQTSTPEEQGMDSAKLVEMVAYYEERRSKNEQILIDSITIVRNGTIIADISLNPLYPRDTAHIIHSCTKSIVSALIGIAIAEGYIEGVDVPVLDIFDEKKIEHIDNRLQALTIKDLLTMQTGFRSQDSYLYQWRGLFAMQATDDWVEFILNLPQDVEPGTRFDYSNMSSFLLSAIIAKTAGMDTISFARIHLFDPLGIEDVRWEKSPQGIDIGWARMWLKPHDMAKIGLLYLQNGKWNDQQIVPARWVEASTTARSYPQKYRPVLDENGERDLQKTIENWIASRFIRPFSDGYGYQWWLDKSGMYSAMGNGGQYIMVVPQEELVVVFTSKLSGIDSFLPAKMLKDYILPAIRSDEAVAANESAQDKLVSLSGPPELLIDATAVPQLPAIALEISGKIYSLDPNPWKYDNFQLIFDPDKAWAEFSYSAKQNDRFHYRIGLDNVYRFTATSGGTYAAVGAWTAPDTFSIEYELVGYSTSGQWTLTFDHDEIVVEEDGVTGTYTYRGRIEQKGMVVDNLKV